MKHQLKDVIREQDHAVVRDTLRHYRGLGLDGFLNFWQTVIPTYSIAFL